MTDDDIYTGIGIEKYNSLTKLIDNRLNEKSQVLVAIDGRCASGKTTLAKLLAGIYDCNVFHMDDFFLYPNQRTQLRYQTPGGNVDYERFSADVLEKLMLKEPFSYSPFDCNNQCPSEPINIIPKKLNIIEGAYSLHPKLLSSYDIKIFLNIDSDLQSRRILSRNGSEIHEIFLKKWIPLEELYFSTMNIEALCDLIFNATE